MKIHARLSFHFISLLLKLIKHPIYMRILSCLVLRVSLKWGHSVIGYKINSIVYIPSLEMLFVLTPWNEQQPETRERKLSLAENTSAFAVQYLPMVSFSTSSPQRYSYPQNLYTKTYTNLELQTVINTDFKLMGCLSIEKGISFGNIFQTHPPNIHKFP